MTEDQFWDIIEQARDVPDDEKTELIQSHLNQLGQADLSAFAAQFSARMAGSYHWPLWGAAYEINGGCSDDGFEYFRAWLICQGREVFRNALRHPDSLADFVNPERDDEREDALGLAGRVYYERTGEELPYDQALRHLAYQNGPTGEDWDFDDQDEVARRLPRLAALYADGLP